MTSRPGLAGTAAAFQVLADALGDGPGHGAALEDVLRRASENMRTYALKRPSLQRELITVEGRSEYLQTLSYLVGRALLARPMRHAE